MDQQQGNDPEHDPAPDYDYVPVSFRASNVALVSANENRAPDRCNAIVGNSPIGNQQITILN